MVLSVAPDLRKTNLYMSDMANIQHLDIRAVLAAEDWSLKALALFSISHLILCSSIYCPSLPTEKRDHTKHYKINVLELNGSNLRNQVH